MASASSAASSRLAQMQMRFQQKQLEEREQKRVQLTDEPAITKTTKLGAKVMGNGKVRQMFDERRRGAGIDRSVPLKPIQSVTAMKVASPTTGPPRAIGATLGRSRQTRSDCFDRKLTNGNAVRVPQRGNKTDHQQLDEHFPKAFSSLNLRESTNCDNGISGDGRNDSNNNKADSARRKSSSNIKLNPVITKKSPNVAPVRIPSRPSTPRNVNNLRSTKVIQTKSMNTAVKAPQRTTPANMYTVKSTVKVVKSSPPPPGMAVCTICGRNFLEERLHKHTQICQKMATTKRKIFDASRHRVKGTEAEKFLKKQESQTTRSNVRTTKYTSLAAATGMTIPANSGIKKNNWRKKHEEFIAAIRAAKQVQAHLARGGKISDLPPPPPSENADYIQCPHCMRRFNQAAAERHIPKCATMLHNKPKPGSKQIIRK